MVTWTHQYSYTEYGEKWIKQSQSLEQAVRVRAIDALSGIRKDVSQIERIDGAPISKEEWEAAGCIFGE